MPINKVSNKKRDGLQKYKVRVNYIADYGSYKQLYSIAYGLDEAKALEMKMQQELNLKQETDVSKITIKQLFDEYISVKKYDVREITLDKFIMVFNCYVSDDIFAIRLDKLTTKVLQEWKISMEQKGLSLTTKKNVYTAFKAIFNYAVHGIPQ